MRFVDTVQYFPRYSSMQRLFLGDLPGMGNGEWKAGSIVDHYTVIAAAKTSTAMIRPTKFLHLLHSSSRPTPAEALRHYDTARAYPRAAGPANTSTARASGFSTPIEPPHVRAEHDLEISAAPLNHHPALARSLFQMPPDPKWIGRGLLWPGNRMAPLIRPTSI